MRRHGSEPGVWTDLPDEFEGDRDAAARRCAELAVEHEGAVNAVSIDKPKPEPLALAS